MAAIVEQATDSAAGQRQPITTPHWSKLECARFGLLMAVVLITYRPVLQCEFVNYDDPAFITSDLEAGLSWQGLVWSVTGAYTQMASHADSVGVAHWHPLVWWTLLLDYQLYGFDAWGYHLTNLLWHLASTLVLYAALRRLTGAAWPSFLVAALFAVHPINVQAVAWVAERKGVVSTFFWMASLWAYARYVERPGWWRYLLVVAALALGLQAKQMLVTLPCVLLLLDYWPLGRWAGTPGAKACLILEKLPLLGLAIALMLMVLLQWRGAAQSAPTMYPTSALIGNALVSYAAYLGQAFLPMNFAPFYLHPGTDLPIEKVLAALGLLLTITAVVVVQLTRRPYLAIGWFWYLGTLVPVIGLVQLGGYARADRYAYVPLIGIYIGVSWLLAERANLSRRAAMMAGTLAAVVLLSLMMVSRIEIEPWRDSTKLWQHALVATEPNAMAYNNLGCALRATDAKAARTQFEAALRLEPAMDLALGNLIGILVEDGELERAADYCQAALRIQPRLAVAYRGLGLVRIRQGDRAQAAECLEKALQLDSRDVQAMASLGWLRFEEGDMAAALRHFQTVLERDPHHVDALYHLGLIQLRNGERGRAASYFRELLRWKPTDELAHVNLGVILKDEGDAIGALRHLREALRLAPDLGVAHYQLGLLLLARGEVKEAATHLEATVRIMPRAAAAHLALGNARLSMGDSAAAARCFRRVLELDPANAEAQARLKE